MDMEEALLQAIQDNPSDWTPWLILADWFEEHNDPQRAEILRLQYILGQAATTAERPLQEERLCQLLRKGVRFCMPVRTNSIGMRLTLVPAGTFLMGSRPRYCTGGRNEHPHEVEITQPFYAGIYPVTQEQYQRVMGQNPSRFSSTGRDKDKVKGMDTRSFPVECVNWDEAADFCRRLSQLPDGKIHEHLYRLATEAEWEYICRGGPFLKTIFSAPDSGNHLDLNHNPPFDGYPKRPTKVGSYPPNLLGLYDLLGNVWEWCADWFEAEYYKRSPRQDPQGPETGKCRVLRGGSWICDSRSCRPAYRNDGVPSSRNGSFGFRVVLVASVRT
ncbi:MAG TPA: SUMF1/EgtB/PvdO family nonheme iron enzyme [Gemmataceae bacterium]|nr:SUMF1/EgtB/PvdO family nonheme iron enzyme [Gemmataceae bacterium]